MNLLELTQAAFMSTLPTADDVAAGRVSVLTDDVMLIVKQRGEWVACGPFQTKDIEWHRLPKDARVYVGDL